MWGKHTFIYIYSEKVQKHTFASYWWVKHANKLFTELFTELFTNFSTVEINFFTGHMLAPCLSRFWLSFGTNSSFLLGSLLVPILDRFGDPFLGPISLQRATQRFFEIGPKIVPKEPFWDRFRGPARATVPSMNVDLFLNN